MKFRALVIDPIGLGAAIGAGLLATLTLLPQARGELVYEEQDQGPVELRQNAQTQDPRATDRQDLRQAIGSSEKARATRQAEIVRPAQPAQVFVAQPAPLPPAPQTQVAVGDAALAAPLAAPAADPQAAPVENLSKTELMRRERVREEIKNEDAIQERLEELRLRDEKRRSDQIVKGDSFLPGPQVSGAAPANGQAPGLAPIQDEVVVAPVTEHPGQPAVVPAVPAGAAPTQAPAPLNPALQTTGAAAPAQSTAEVKGDVDSNDEKSQVYVRAGAGLSNMNVNDAFDLKPHYALGGALGVQSSENVSFELGYTYATYGIAVASSNPVIQQLQWAQQAQGLGNPETLGLNKNVFDAGIRLSLLGAQSKIRPFIGGGGAYSKQYLNYASGYTAFLNQYGLSSMAQDYESSAFLGFVSTGVDVKISKQLSLGAQFKYYGVISSNENQQLNYVGFYGNPYAFGGATADKQSVGASLSDSSYYTIEATTSFTF